MHENVRGFCLRIIGHKMHGKYSCVCHVKLFIKSVSANYLGKVRVF